MTNVENNNDKVWVTVSRNVNLGKFENYKIEAGYNQTLKDGDDPMELITDMEMNLTIFVNKRARLLKKKKRRTMED